MNDTTPIKMVIPRWGRTSVNFLNKLYSVTGDERIPLIADAVADSKKNISTDYMEAFDHLKELVEKGHQYISLSPDNKRSDSPWRIGFLGIDTFIDGIPVRIQGDEPHNGTSLIKLAEADIALAGLDELLATNYTYLDEKTQVTCWGAYNANVQKDTDLRIIGSANLKTPKEILDFVGLFLITQKQEKYKNLDELANENIPIFVKGRYEGAVAYAYGTNVEGKLNLVPVENVEDAVLATPNSYGIEIVQTGNTMHKKGLVLLGRPLINSESLFTVDKAKYCNNPRVQKVLDAFGTIDYFSTERAGDFTKWFYNLGNNLGKNWVDKPSNLLNEFFGHGQYGLWPMRAKGLCSRPQERELIMDPRLSLNPKGEMNDETEIGILVLAYATAKGAIQNTQEGLR